jgi:predicted transcriptional regulator
MSTSDRSTVLTLRVPPDLDRRITHHARKTKQSKSVVLREALQQAFGSGQPPDDPAREARRQSLLVSGRASERDAIAFVEHAADTRGWR